MVPHGGGLEVARARREVLANDVLVEGDAQARLVGNGDVALVDDGLFDAFHQVLPPRDIQRVILASQEILRGGGAVHAGQRADGQAGVVHRHRHAVLHGRVADLMRLKNSARGGDIGVNLADRLLLAQIDEALLQVDVLAGQDRRRGFHR